MPFNPADFDDITLDILRAREVHAAMFFGPITGAVFALGLSTPVDLQTIDDSALAPGTIVNTITPGAWWYLDPSSAAALSNLVRSTQSGVGRWLRVWGADAKALRAADIYVDAVAGNDFAAGSALAPLRTFSEVRWRMGAAAHQGNLTIHVVATTAEVLVVDWTHASPATEATAVVGAAIAPALLTGVVTANQAYNSAARLDEECTAAAIPVSWTASGLIRKRCRVTSGAVVGATAWALADLGAKNARLSRWRSPAGLEVSPAPLDGLVVEDIIGVGGILILNQIVLAISDLAVGGPLAFIGTAPATLDATTCSFAGVLLGATAANLRGCLFAPAGDSNIESREIDFFAGSAIAPVAAGSVMRVQRASLLRVRAVLISQDCALRVDEGVVSLEADAAWFDVTAAPATIQVRVGGAIRFNAGVFWGTGCNVANGINVAPGACITYDAGATFDIQTPGVNQTLTGTVVTAYAALPAIDATKQSAFVAS